MQKLNHSLLTKTLLLIGMKKLLTTLALSISMLTVANAQGYTLGYYTQAYTPLTGATIIADNQAELNNPPPIYLPPGLNFTIAGVSTSNQLYVDNNAYTSNNSNEDLPFFIFTPIQCYSSGSFVFTKASISYKIDNAAPNRILKVECRNFRISHTPYSFVDSDSVAFQYWLYEGSNKIEFHYGPNYSAIPSTLNPSLDFIGIQNIKISNADTLVNIYTAYADPAAPMLNTTQVNYSSAEEVILPQLYSLPTDGQVYVFNPTTTLSIGENTVTNSNLNLYPNPAKEQVTLQNIEQGKAYKITLLNSLGQIVRTVNNTPSLDIRDVPQGMYVVQIQQGDNTTTKKLIIE